MATCRFSVGNLRASFMRHELAIIDMTFAPQMNICNLRCTCISIYELQTNITRQSKDVN
jgi:hypothetical protein